MLIFLLVCLYFLFSHFNVVYDIVCKVLQWQLIIFCNKVNYCNYFDIQWCLWYFLFLWLVWQQESSLFKSIPGLFYKYIYIYSSTWNQSQWAAEVNDVIALRARVWAGSLAKDFSSNRSLPSDCSLWSDIMEKPTSAAYQCGPCVFRPCWSQIRAEWLHDHSKITGKPQLLIM